MTAPRAEKTYEKYAWIILLAIAIVGFIASFIDVFVGVGTGAFPDAQTLRNLTGLTWDQIVTGNPAMTNIIRELERELASAELGFSVFGIAIFLKPYRRGEKWAWYVSWYFPALGIAFIANELIIVHSNQVLLAVTLFLILSLLGLLLPYRKFFPRK